MLANSGAVKIPNNPLLKTRTNKFINGGTGFTGFLQGLGSDNSDSASSPSEQEIPYNLIKKWPSACPNTFSIDFISQDDFSEGIKFKETKSDVKVFKVNNSSPLFSFSKFK